ncbi:flagellar hook-associated protein FlgK [Betaproteobacteria bacterium]|nr:flagellar hook-associated protein FlgK [Betaproteobacteria bacterium]GHU01394.1 flagellar hook-associated protein FlgK [Betaproteobacteria bacterium]GHU10354.1 flagellar hook-associated protein FlgK [Betaproteobacteria bacterium]
MSSMLNIGVTGLNAAQGQLVTTSHNISSIDVAGYHRQKVIQTTLDPMFSGAGFFGNGTRIANVNRAYDQFLENQVLSTNNAYNAYSAYYNQIRQIDNLLADPTTGLAPAMDEFFAGVQEVAANPTSAAARQALLSSSQALVTRFQGLDTRLTEIREGVEYEINASIEQINTYASAIAELNQRIVVAQAAGAAHPVNDLLDQRWQLVSELNELIKVRTQEQDDGSLSVFIGSGQNMVIGNTATRLVTVRNINDPQRSDIAILTPNGNNQILLPDRVLSGGQLGGLLDFRREGLDPAQNRLGLIAATMAMAVNNQHKLGVDLDGALGLDFFKISSPRVLPLGAAEVEFDLANFGQLTDANYTLSYDGANYTLTNDNTKNSVTSAGPTINFEGLNVDLSTSNLATGQTAAIQPTRYMARDISVAVNDPRKVAAGTPVIADVPVNNLGTGKVSNIVMSDVSNIIPPWAENAELSFNAATGELELSPASLGAGFTIANADGSTPATFNVATDNGGKTFVVTNTAGYEFTFTLGGAPQNGDQFILKQTEKGIADNRNANLLGLLQNTRLMFDSGTGNGPTATLGGSYSQLVNKIGNKTHEVKINADTQKLLNAQAQDSRDSLSAVNLDEEAANLIRYQQAYQACGRVMSVAQRLFDELISLAR